MRGKKAKQLRKAIREQLGVKDEKRVYDEMSYRRKALVRSEAGLRIIEVNRKSIKNSPKSFRGMCQRVKYIWKDMSVIERRVAAYSNKI